MSAARPETVLVTGASSGIGLELARCFAADGSRLILIARNTPALEKLAEELRRDYKVEAIVLTADLSLPETPGNIFSELKGRGTVVDVLVNNAGFGAHGGFSELPLQRQLEMIRVNVTALTELTGLFLPGILERHCGGVLNVASVAGFVPGPGMAVYYATKAFVLSFTEALAGELADATGIKVVALCPGPTKTNFFKVAHASNAQLVRVASMSAKEVARQGHKAFRGKGVVVISGWKNRLLVVMIWLTPRPLIRRIAKKFNGF
jgi:short-subunit dehydrogenase